MIAFSARDLLVVTRILKEMERNCVLMFYSTISNIGNWSDV